MMGRKFWGGVCACVLAAWAGSPAVGAVITYSGFGHSLVTNVTYNGSPGNEIAGELLITVDGTPHIAYCVDLDAGTTPIWDATLQPVSVINGGLQIGWLYDMYAAGVATNEEAAGLQIAMWEILADHPAAADLGAGNFLLNSPPVVLAQANFYLSQIPADLTGYIPKSVIVLSGDNPRSQHMIIPEPASILGLLLGCALIRRRR